VVEEIRLRGRNATLVWTIWVGYSPLGDTGIQELGGLRMGGV